MSHVVVAIAVALLTLAPARSQAQADSTKTEWNLVVGGGAVVIKIGHDRSIDIGVSGPARTAAIACTAAAVSQFIADLRKVLRPTKPQPQAILADRTGGGTLSVTRVVRKGKATYHLFASDDPVTGGFTLTTSPVELHATSLALQMAAEKAVQQAAQPAVPPAVQTATPPPA